MNLSILLSFWRVHKCRRTVLQALAPFVARSTLVGWGDDMALGFLVTLITACAERAAGPLASDALGTLQTDVWGALTGLPAEPIGERIVLLSAGGDPRFAEGASRALVFAAALAAGEDGAQERSDILGVDGGTPRFAAGHRQSLCELWDSLLASVAGRDDPRLSGFS